MPADDVHDVAVRLAVMNDNRQAKLFRQVKLRLENAALRLARGKVVLVGLSDLSDGPRFFCVCPKAVTRRALLIETVRLVRMPAHGGIDMRMPRARERAASALRASVAGFTTSETPRAGREARSSSRSPSKASSS
jgi:hypothetical protein